MRSLSPDPLILHMVPAFWVCQVVAVLVHEAGHVLAGLMVGRKPRQVLIGLDGKILGHCRCFGVPVIFSGWPAKAFVRFHSMDRSLASLWIVAAGPLAGFIAAAIGLWFYLPWKGQAVFSLLPHTVAGIWMGWFVFWNLWLSLYNLRAFEIQSKVYGRVASDGLQIRRHFQPAWTPSMAARERQSGSGFILLSAIAGGGCVMVASILGALCFSNENLRANWALPAMLMFFLGLSFLMVRITVREIASNKARAEASNASNAAPRIPSEERLSEFNSAWEAQDWAGLRNLLEDIRKEHPLDPTWIRLDLWGRHASGDEVGVLDLCRELKALPPDSQWATLAVERELFSLIQLEKTDAWQAALQALPNQIEEKDEVVQILDRVATHAIREKSTELCRSCLPLVRKYCEERPEHLSLRGTLGGLLAELGEREEARQVMEQVMQGSNSLTDLSITSLMLAELSLKEGRTREAAKLARKSLDLDDLDWVVKRARAVMEAVGSQGLPAQAAAEKD